MTVPGNIDALLLGGQRGYQIERSLRFNSADSAYLNRTPASAGNRRTFTWSGWFKVGNHSSSGEYYLLGTNGTADSTFFYIEIRNNQLRLGSFNSGTFGLFSTQLFRDPSAWYHLVVAVDTTQATAANRAKAYVNGTEITTWSTANYPSQNSDLGANDTRAHAVGAGYASGSPYAYWDGLLTECHLIDGQALTPSSFGETDTITGVWKPKAFSGGSYGTNGFYLKFADNSGTTSTTLGKDSSGNSNNWTPNNFSVTAGAGNDSMIDTPTPYADGGNGRGNYATLNVLAKAFTNGGSGTTSNGNLQIAYTATNWYGHKSTIAVTSGKWYYEVENTNGTIYVMCGFSLTTVSAERTSGVYRYRSSGEKVNVADTSYGATWSTAGDICGVAFDLDAGTITFYKNGVSQGTAFSGISAGEYAAEVIVEGSSVAHVNFGQRAFAYTPPSGFLALNTQNLPEPSIKKPSSYFDAKLYTGNGSTQTISGLGFSPDLVWIKKRSGSEWHCINDTVRGAELYLSSNTTNAESGANNVLTAFTSTGYTVGSQGIVNDNGFTYVSWCWDESATPGFDIVTYTGNGSARTIAHSLGVAPKMMIVKNRTTAGTSWAVYTEMTGAGNYLRLNSTIASTAGSTFWNSTAPTSSVFSVGTDSDVNANTNEHVAYLWSEVAGFSKFGSYTGNGSSDGPFVACNFRPRWLLIKRTDSANDWVIKDAARNSYNTTNLDLYANTSQAEVTFNEIDFTSNGFKIRNSNASTNASGGTYVFAAFAETPFRYSLAR